MRGRLLLQILNMILLENTEKLTKNEVLHYFDKTINHRTTHAFVTDHDTTLLDLKKAIEVEVKRAKTTPRPMNSLRRGILVKLVRKMQALERFELEKRIEKHLLLEE